MSVEEMKAHGYVGIPGPQEAIPGTPATPVAQSAEETAEPVDQDAPTDAVEPPQAVADGEPRPSVPQDLNHP